MLDAHVVKARRAFTVDVAVRVGSGEACALFGPSGAGKSTVLACVAGAEVPDGGRIVHDGATLFPPPLALHRRHVGYLTQEANVFPHLSVGANVGFGLRDGERAQRDDATDAWLRELRDRLQLGAIWSQPGRAISGGQARRVALARMLARRPPLVLLDEPFTALDRTLVRELLAAIAEWQRAIGFTLLVVDHDADLLARLAPRAVAIEAGHVVQDATWDELRARPATPGLAALLAPL